MRTQQKLTHQELKQLQHLLALVEGAIIVSLQNVLCAGETMLQFCKEKNKLARLFLVTETNLTRHISQQQILALSRIVEMGQKFMLELHEKKLVGPTYMSDFLILVNQLDYKKNWLSQLVNRLQQGRS